MYKEHADEEINNQVEFSYTDSVKNTEILGSIKKLKYFQKWKIYVFTKKKITLKANVLYFGKKKKRPHSKQYAKSL